MINKRLLSLATAVTLVMGLTSLAMAGIPDPSLSTAASVGGCITITPGGNGPALNAPDNLQPPMTITVTVLDGSSNPIPGYPFQDIWWTDPNAGTGVEMCQGGSVADANTNASGVTTISGSASGGGNTQGGVQVYLAGVAVGSPLLTIDVNSPDINGDLSVNLADLGNFATDFNAAAYDFRSDFNCDNTENLADVGKFATHNSETCP